MNDTVLSVTRDERQTLRDLATQKAEIAALPIQEQRKQLWRDHNSLRQQRPMMLLFPEGSWTELVPESTLTCRGKVARRIERQLRMDLYQHEHFDDDSVIEKIWNVRAAIGNTGWGIEARVIKSDMERGAWKFDPVINTPSDLDKIKYPEVIYDEQQTQALYEFHADLFGDILDVRRVGENHVCFHLMAQYTKLRGLEQTLMDMVMEPNWLHDAMHRLTEGHLQRVQQLVDMNLLSLNNDNTYNNSGGNGWTDELPAEGFDPNRVRKCDVWACAEAQELAVVSPEMHREFAMTYEAKLLDGFGLTGYACCDPLDDKLADVFELIPNVRRISISPTANVDVCAPQMKGDYIFSWKPQPVHLVGNFDEAMIRRYIRHTIEVCQAHGCMLEMVLKDTHTCENHPERFDQWTRIAREEIGAACSVA